MVDVQVGNFVGTCAEATNDVFGVEYVADVAIHADVEFVDTEDEHGIYDVENNNQEAFDAANDAVEYVAV